MCFRESRFNSQLEIFTLIIRKTFKLKYCTAATLRSMKKSPNSIDIHVGCRVRLLRRRLGVSQQKLADAVGVTFQQMQKYEKGTNQISSSRLHQIAQTLQVPPASLFKGIPRRSARRSTLATSPTHLFKFIAAPDGLAMAKAFMRLDPKLRRQILDLVLAITDTDK